MEQVVLAVQVASVEQPGFLVRLATAVAASILAAAA